MCVCVCLCSCSRCSLACFSVGGVVVEPSAANLLSTPGNWNAVFRRVYAWACVFLCVCVLRGRMWVEWKMHLWAQPLIIKWIEAQLHFTWNKDLKNQTKFWIWRLEVKIWRVRVGGLQWLLIETAAQMCVHLVQSCVHWKGGLIAGCQA